MNEQTDKVNYSNHQKQMSRRKYNKSKPQNLYFHILSTHVYVNVFLA